MTVGPAPASPVARPPRARSICWPTASWDLRRRRRAQSKYDEYVSDPAKPVPYRQLPTLDGESHDSTWGEWLVDDQRFAGSRPDVLVYETEPLQEPLRVAGQPLAHLSAATSGSDSDWVVKIIDVWPSEVP